MIIASGFSFNGIHSETVEVTKVNTESGLLTEQFSGSITVDTFLNSSSYKSHITHTEEEPLEIPLVLYFDENITFDKEQEVKRWLIQGDYCPLIFDDNPSIVYYAKLNSEINLTHNSVNSGYLECTMLTNSPYKFSDYITFEDQSTSNEEYLIREIMIDGDLPSFPVIEVVSPSVTYLEIYNESTQERCVLNESFTNLTVDFLSEYQELETRATSPSELYDAHNGKFITLKRGKNIIKFKGTFRFKMTYQNVYL